MGKERAMLKIVEEVTTVYRVLDAEDRMIRELPTQMEAEAFKAGFEHAMPVWETDEDGVEADDPAEPDGEVFEDPEPINEAPESSAPF